MTTQSPSATAALIIESPAPPVSAQGGCDPSITSARSWGFFLMNGPFSAAAAGGAAAFADVAAAGRAHLRSAGEAQRGVRRAALLELDQLGGGVRAGGAVSGAGRARWRRRGGRLGHRG